MTIRSAPGNTSRQHALGTDAGDLAADAAALALTDTSGTASERAARALRRRASTATRATARSAVPS
ncbi:hypothetical protein [Streptomyces albidochromogenes]|uniref:Uncharacterized protein n=1 Tax=Streptomyces albidochromogenes TaxID=329524 RepID=A0ABW6FKM0_9ACTN